MYFYPIMLPGITSLMCLNGILNVAPCKKMIRKRRTSKTASSSNVRRPVLLCPTVHAYPNRCRWYLSRKMGMVKSSSLFSLFLICATSPDCKLSLSGRGWYVQIYIRLVSHLPCHNAISCILENKLKTMNDTIHARWEVSHLFG